MDVNNLIDARLMGRFQPVTAQDHPLGALGATIDNGAQVLGTVASLPKNVMRMTHDNENFLSNPVKGIQ